jgi:hypothetical protein
MKYDISVRYGGTRFVLLFNDYAIKIGKFRLINLIKKCIQIGIFNNKKEKQKLESKTFCESFYKCLFAGLHANKIEFEYYDKHRDPRVMPTIRKFLGGWIIVQIRGEPITETEVSEWHFPENINKNYYDIRRAEQFCRDKDGKIVLVDYGKNITTQLLSSSL